MPPFETVQALAAWFHISLDTLSGNEEPDTVSLYGLTDEQIEIVKELVKQFNEKTTSAGKEYSTERYVLLGKITENLL